MADTWVGTSSPASTGAGGESPEEIRARVRAYLGLHLDSNVTDPFANAPDRLALIRAKLVDAVRANGWSDDDQLSRA